MNAWEGYALAEGRFYTGDPWPWPPLSKLSHYWRNKCWSPPPFTKRTKNKNDHVRKSMRKWHGILHIHKLIKFGGHPNLAMSQPKIDHLNMKKTTTPNTKPFWSITMFYKTNNVLWNIVECEESIVEYCLSHITLLRIWIMLWQQVSILNHILIIYILTIWCSLNQCFVKVHFQLCQVSKAS